MDSTKKLRKQYSWLQANSQENSAEDLSKIKELTNKNINTGFPYNSATS